MKVTKIVSSEVLTVGTSDGYIYRWEQPGQAIDVLPQHRTEILALPGMSKRTVDVVDEPVVLPALAVSINDLPDTLVRPEPLEDEVLDLSDAPIEPEPTSDPPTEEPTLVEPAPVATTEPSPVVVDDTWSDRDLEQLNEQRTDIQA